VSLLRRLDHVAVVVRDTASAVRFFETELGLRVLQTERVESPRAQLTYLDAGNIYIQLVEPLDESSEIAASLAKRGEGLHHICFSVENIADAASKLSHNGASPMLGSGRGRVSAFVPGELPFGLRVELTDYRYDEDVDRNAGFLGQIEPPPGP
jgi:methylmalonyl-CoA/ethylmalonyl-CoA epimerase